MQHFCLLKYFFFRIPKTADLFCFAFNIMWVADLMLDHTAPQGRGTVQSGQTEVKNVPKRWLENINVVDNELLVVDISNTHKR